MPTNLLSRLFRKKPIKVAARALYDQLSLAAREPALYGEGRVPDSPDGRFEMLALHASVLFGRLSKRGDQAEETSQEVFNIMFSALDHALRELGVGDLSVGKRIRKLAESFYGRMAVYTGALELPEGEQMGVLAEAIGVHVLEKDPATQGFATELASRIRDWTLDLQGVADETLLSGELPLPR
jgi:cytochrome b pre-mRNA-processing protein 3